MNIDILDKEELPINEVIKECEKLINPRIGIIKKFSKTPYWNDEPKFFQYAAEICDTSVISGVKNLDKFSNGLSLDEEKALVKALCEAIERYCIAIYNNSDLIYKSYKNIKNGLNPKGFVVFSKKQLKNKNFKICNFTNDSKFKWVKGFSIFKNESIWIPAQTVFVPYYFENNEPILRFPITTGAACGTSFSGAVYRGICEIIERDAFIINYLNKIPRELIDINKINNETIQKLIESFSNYSLEVYVFDITIDLKIPSVMAIIIDRSGKGPAVSVGLKTDLNPEKAIIGSIEEAQSGRLWIRWKSFQEPNYKIKPKKMFLQEDRGLFWFNKNKIKFLDFLLKNDKIKKVNRIKNLSSKYAVKNLKTTLKILKKNKLETIVIDITTSDVNKTKFKIVKTIIPEMHPLYLDEQFKYLGGKRLYTVPKKLGYEIKSEDEINPIPHPFL